MNALPVIYIFTHDSIGNGRGWPDTSACGATGRLAINPRYGCPAPADANETVAAWRVAVGRKQGPVALVLTRQGLPVLDFRFHPGIPAGVPLGGISLLILQTSERPDIVLIATGSEVHLALEARDGLRQRACNARVVSMPSTNLFASQSDDYREKVLPADVPLLVIEAGSPIGWQSFVGPRIAVIGIDTFGASAPGPVVMQHYGSLWRTFADRLIMCSTSSRRKPHARRIASDHGGFALKEQISDLLRGAAMRS